MVIVWHHCGDFSSEQFSGQTIVGSRILRYLVECGFDVRVVVYNAIDVVSTECFLRSLGIANVFFQYKNMVARFIGTLFARSCAVSEELNIFGTVGAIDFVRVVPANSTLLAGDLESRKFWQRPKLDSILTFGVNCLRERKFRFFQNVTFYSSYDHDAYLGGNSCIVPIGYDVLMASEVANLDYASDLVFTGNFNYKPNLLAAKWLLNFISDNKYSISLVGYNASLLRANSVGTSVLIASDVSDVHEYIRSGKIFVCPLFLGTGMKNKLLAAMECGVPIVCTPLSVEGFDRVVLSGVYLADSEVTFLSAIESVLADYDGALLRAAVLREHVREHYGWNAVLEQFVAELVTVS